MKLKNKHHNITPAALYIYNDNNYCVLSFSFAATTWATTEATMLRITIIQITICIKIPMAIPILL